MLERQLSRRLFLRATTVGAIGIAGTGLLAACGGGDDDDDATPTTAASGGDATAATTAPQATAGTSGGEATVAATQAPAAEATATTAEEPAMGSSLIGKLEGPTIVTDESRWPKTFQEAPQLAARVASGELPAVAERVSQAPIVIEPLHEIGTYGGTWRRGFTGPGDGINGERVAGMDTVIGWHYEATEYAPNLAQAWEMDADGTAVTFDLRPGHCWSDGAPFTANDFVWWYENMFLNDEVLPVKSADMLINGEAGKIVKVDDVTVRFEFPTPYFLFLDMLAAGLRSLSGQSVVGMNGGGPYSPAHYLEPFHVGFADADKLAAAVAEAGVDNWAALIKSKADWRNNPELPVLTPWKTESPSNSPVWSLVRNPYSIWVDTDGNQLPYIDDVVMGLAENLEVLNLRAIAGEYDFQARHIDMSKLPVILENRDKGNYDVYLDTGDYGSDIELMINLSYDADPGLAELFNNVDFRRALSLGVERDEINEIFFLGTGTSGSPAPSDDNLYSPGPEYRTLWATYDPDEANAMLDGIGLTEKDGSGFRMRPDGKGRVSMEVITVGATFVQFTQMCEMISNQWRDIGIELVVREVERSLRDTMIAANEHQVSAWSNDGSESLFSAPKGVIPRRSDAMAPAWGLWFATGGESGIEPPDEFKALVEDFNRAFAATTEDRVKIGTALWANAIDQVYTIGVVGLSAASMGVRIVKRNMGNIPARQYNSPVVKNPGISCPPSFFFKDL